MRFSIIIPTYNSASVIERCLKSIVSQSFSDWEALVMDGASKDGTAAIAESFHDSRIRICSEPDSGLYEAMNKGIDRAQGDWLYFLGSDDWLYNENSLRDISKELDDKYDVVYGEVDSDLSELHKGEWSLEKIGANRCHQGIFYNKRFFAKGQRYNLKYKTLADFDINLQWLLNSDYVSEYVNMVIAHYSVGGLSSRFYDTAFGLDHGKLMIKYNKNRLTPRFKKLAAKAYITSNELAVREYISFKVYYICQYLLQHFQQFFHIPQNTFRNTDKRYKRSLL